MPSYYQSKSLATSTLPPSCPTGICSRPSISFIVFSPYLRGSSFACIRCSPPKAFAFVASASSRWYSCNFQFRYRCLPVVAESNVKFYCNCHWYYPTPAADACFHQFLFSILLCLLFLHWVFCRFCIAFQHICQCIHRIFVFPLRSVWLRNLSIILQLERPQSL